MSSNLINTKDYKEYTDIVFELFSNDKVKQMDEFRQHYDSSCLEHCLEVSYISYKICKKIGLDYKSAARAGLLHDLFLYDWRESRKKLHLESYHAFVHPRIALENANKLFDLNDMEKDIIVKHMWPVTLFHLPKYKESYIITIVDKYSALISFRKYYSKHLRQTKLFKFAYSFVALLFIKL